MASLSQLLITMTMLHVCQLVTSYSFKNCIKNDGKTFTCARRVSEHNISAIVGDLPLSSVNLNISFNNIQLMPDKSFSHLPNLRQLRLDQNNISTLGRFAFQNLHQLKLLNLSSNNISHLEQDLFKDLESLTFLALANNKIKVLPAHIFLSVLKLITVQLEDNNLEDFSQIASAVSHLHNLRSLNVSRNKLSSLRHGNFSLPFTLSKLFVQNNILSSLGCNHSFLKNLKDLDLSFNPLSTEAFQQVDLANLNNLRLQSTNVNIIYFLNSSNVMANSVDFSGTSLEKESLLEEFCKILRRKADNITNLKLNSNQIHSLSNTSLQYCPPHIGQLDLSVNHLRKMNCLSFLTYTKEIEGLKVEHNHLQSLEPCKKEVELKYLKHLSYRYNRIQRVNNDAFYNTPHLVTLNLNINSIAWFGSTALKGLDKLKDLRLDNNLITDLFNTSFEDQVNLETLNLNFNRISVIFDKVFWNLGKLKTLHLGGNIITQIKKQGFYGLKMLSNLILNDNRLKEIDTSLYDQFSHQLKVLKLQSNQIRFWSMTVISPFLNLSQLNVLDLSRQQPNGLIVVPHQFFRGLSSLKYLSLGNNQISCLAPDAFDDLTELDYLYLDNCCVGGIQLDSEVFKNLSNLTRLLIENMGLQNFSKDVFGNLTKLQSLQLNRNTMHTIDMDALNSLPNLQYMDIRNVPLSCTCENLQLQNWTVKNSQVQVPFLQHSPCQKNSKHRFYNFDTKVCFVDMGHYLFFISAAVIFPFTTTPIIYMKLYWTFKYSFFVFRAWFSAQWRRLRDEEENCAFDAFISYNFSDEQWVMEQLVPNLEGSGSSFKLCLHHRDFEVGRNIVDNIVSAVYSSRKTICVVSQNFLRSEWCSLEIQLASYRLFDEHRDVLLLVFLESISERQISSYHRMRKVMLKKTYLQWPGADCSDPAQAQKLFWTHLRRAMKETSQCESDASNEDSFQHNKAQESECEMTDDTQYLLP